MRVVQRQLGWLEVDDEDAHVHWCDTSASTERLVRLARPQVRPRRCRDSRVLRWLLPPGR